MRKIEYSTGGRKFHDFIPFLLFIAIMLTIAAAGFPAINMYKFTAEMIQIFPNFLYILGYIGGSLVFIFIIILSALIFVPETILYATCLLFPLFQIVFSLGTGQSLFIFFATFISALQFVTYFTYLKFHIEDIAIILNAASCLLVPSIVPFVLSAFLIVLINFTTICNLLFFLSEIFNTHVLLKFGIIILMYWNIMIAINFVSVFISSSIYLNMYSKKKLSFSSFFTSICNSCISLGSIIMATCINEIVYFIKWFDLELILDLIPMFHKLISMPSLYFLRALFAVARYINGYIFIDVVVYNNSYSKAARNSYFEIKIKNIKAATLLIKMLIIFMMNGCVYLILILLSLISRKTFKDVYRLIISYPECMTLFFMGIYVYLVVFAFIVVCFDSALRGIVFVYINDKKYMEENFREIYRFLEVNSGQF